MRDGQLAVYNLEQKLAQPGDTTGRLSILFSHFYLKTEVESNFGKVVL
jgi:hypothetical protein